MNHLVNLVIGAAVAAMIAVVGLVAINTMEQRGESKAYTPAGSEFGPVDVVEVLAQPPLAALDQWEVLCSSVDAGVTTASLMTDTGGTVHRASAWVIGSDSSTCVRVGGSDVTSSTGESVGTGCRSGAEFSADTRSGYCKSTGAAVTVDVTAAH